MSMMPVMSDEKIAELKDELKEYKKQIDALRRDMEVVAKHSISLRNAVLSIASQSEYSRFGSDVKTCREFVDKYQIRIG